MKTYLTNLWDWLRTSLWVVPAILATIAVAMALLLPMVDSSFDTKHLPGVGTTATAARATLSAIAGAMMSVTGTVFSITIVTLSLTSQQFGPRLLRTFVHDLPTQFTLGTFLSTGIYCLLVLRVVEEQDDVNIVPHLSVTVAVLLTVFSMAALIYFISHIAVLIQAPRVVEAVAADLDDAIDRLFPERIGQPMSLAEQHERDSLQQAEQLGEEYEEVLSNRAGYIQAVDIEGLMTLGGEADLVIRLCLRPGHFVSQEALIAKVWHRGTDVPEDLTGRVNECFILGMRRTPRQDVECSIEELVEVAVRSLSPGINDPFTAVNCIDRLTSSMVRLVQRKHRISRHCDDDGQLRLIVSTVAFPNALGAAFNQIRQYGQGSTAVLIRLLEAFVLVAHCASRDEDREAVRNHADIVLRAAERSLAEEADLRAVKSRHAQVIESFRQREAKSSQPIENHHVE